MSASFFSQSPMASSYNLKNTPYDSHRDIFADILRMEEMDNDLKIINGLSDFKKK